MVEIPVFVLIFVIVSIAVVPLLIMSIFRRDMRQLRQDLAEEQFQRREVRDKFYAHRGEALSAYRALGLEKRPQQESAWVVRPK